MKLFHTLTTIAILLFGYGCAEANHVKVTTVFSDGNCKATTEGVFVIDYAALAELRGTHLIEMTEAPDAAAAPLRLIAIVPPASRTAGYSLTLADAMIPLADPLVLRIKVNRPAADAILMQVITHPCLVVGVEDAAVKRVRVIDDSNQVVGEADVSKP